MNLIQVLGLALGSAWTSGINLYATVAVLGLLQRASSPSARRPARTGQLDHHRDCAGTFVIEFFADKVPYLDTIWDAIHTFIRVPAGAVIAAAATSDISPAVQIVALLLGGGLALSTHGTKATIRASANVSPEPLSNWILSLVEDVIAVGSVVLAVLHPVVILVVILIFLLIFAWILPKVVRRIRRMLAALRAFFGGRSLAAQSGKT